MPEFQIVETTVSDKAEALLPLLQAHRDELAAAPHLMALAPNVDAYHALENTRSLLALVAYRGEEIVGYSINFIGPHLHYSALRYAHNDALYIKPEYRRGRLGLRLMRETERLAQERGARMMTWHAKPGTTLEKLVQRLNYEIEETIYFREL